MNRKILLLLVFFVFSISNLCAQVGFAWQSHLGINYVFPDAYDYIEDGSYALNMDLGIGLSLCLSDDEEFFIDVLATGNYDIFSFFYGGEFKFYYIGWDFIGLGFHLGGGIEKGMFHRRAGKFFPDTNDKLKFMPDLVYYRAGINLYFIDSPISLRFNLEMIGTKLRSVGFWINIPYGAKQQRVWIIYM